MSQPEDLEVLSKKAETVKIRWPFYREMIERLVPLLTESIKANSRVRLNKDIFQSVHKNKMFSRGKSVFRPEQVPIDVDLTQKLYLTLAERALKSSAKAGMHLKNVLSGPRDQINRLVQGVLRSDFQVIESECERYGVDPAAVKLLLRLALRPSLKVFSQTVTADMDMDKWFYGHCPVCGSGPALAQLEERTRRLYCSVCETSWPYHRLRCPFCENENQQDLSYYYVEGEKGLRMDLCRRCGRRLKTIDPRYISGPIIPILDEVVFSHLEMAMEEEMRRKR